MTFDLSRRKVRAGSRVHARPLVVKFGETGLVQDVRVEVSEHEWWPLTARSLMATWSLSALRAFAITC